MVASFLRSALKRPVGAVQREQRTSHGEAMMETLRDLGPMAQFSPISLASFFLFLFLFLSLSRGVHFCTSSVTEARGTASTGRGSGSAPMPAVLSRSWRHGKLQEDSKQQSIANP